MINWQSYSSNWSKLLQKYSCSKEASVMSGQLSNSNTCNVSVTDAQLDMPSCRMPSSVIHSHLESV